MYIGADQIPRDKGDNKIRLYLKLGAGGTTEPYFVAFPYFVEYDDEEIRTDFPEINRSLFGEYDVDAAPIPSELILWDNTPVVVDGTTVDPNSVYPYTNSQESTDYATLVAVFTDLYDTYSPQGDVYIPVVKPMPFFTSINQSTIVSGILTINLSGSMDNGVDISANGQYAYTAFISFGYLFDFDPMASDFVIGFLGSPTGGITTTWGVNIAPADQAQLLTAANVSGSIDNLSVNVDALRAELVLLGYTPGAGSFLSSQVFNSSFKAGFIDHKILQ